MYVAKVIPKITRIADEVIVITLQPKLSLNATQLVDLTRCLAFNALHYFRQIKPLTQHEHDMEVIIHHHISQEPDAPIVTQPLERADDEIAPVCFDQRFTLVYVSGDEVHPPRLRMPTFT